MPSATPLASRPARRPARSLRVPKGEQTRVSIIDAALTLASRLGLEGLTIGVLADTLGMSKSGVFAHFGSRDELQIAVIQAYHQQFEAEVFAPALAEPRGLPRLRAMFQRWMHRVAAEIDAGCIYISGAVEFDDRAGPVRDALVASVKAWQMALQRAVEQAIAAGHVNAQTHAAQVVFEIHGLILALHHDARFLRNPSGFERAQRGFDDLLARHTP